MKQQITDYDELRPKLNNGDLVMFRGKGFASLIIRWFCSIVNGMKPTKYSHIGFIYLNDNRVWLTESTTQMYDDYETKKGVRCIPLSITLILYPGEIYLRQLKMVRDEKDIAEMRSYIDVHDGKPYEQHWKELENSAKPKPTDWNIDNNTDFFCSELVAGLYLLWRLISHSKNSYSPDEFKEGGLVDNEMKTSIRKAELLETVRLK